MSETITVGLAEGKTVKNKEVLVTYALGSCVGICLYDQRTMVAGMAHIMLPCKAKALSASNDFKFADAGLLKLLEQMLKCGAIRSHITAKIFGGAEMFRVEGGGMRIGERNVNAVKDALKEQMIPLIAEDTGKNYGRSIWFDSQTGIVRIKSIKKEIYK